MMLATLALAVPMGCFIPDDKHCSDMIPVGQPFPNFTKNCPDQAYTDPVVTTILAAYPNQPGHRGRRRLLGDVVSRRAAVQRMPLPTDQRSAGRGCASAVAPNIFHPDRRRMHRYLMHA
jgi:hypothetical protein